MKEAETKSEVGKKKSNSRKKSVRYICNIFSISIIRQCKSCCKQCCSSCNCEEDNCEEDSCKDEHAEE